MTIIEWLNKTDESGNDLGNILVDEYIYIISGMDEPEAEEFKNTNEYKLGLKIQEAKLKKYGIAQRLHPSLVMFLLTNLHGYSKQDIKESKYKVKTILD